MRRRRTVHGVGEATRGRRVTPATPVVVATAVLVGVALGGLAAPLAAQSGERAPSGEFRPPTPSDRHRQDPDRNNLVHPPGYRTATPGSLGAVETVGPDGAPPVILVGGLGMGWRVFDSLVDRLDDRFRLYGVSLAGYGGSSAPPMPPEGTSYGERTWLAGAQKGLADLIEDEGMDRPVIVAFYTEAANAVTRLAASRPDLVGGVLLVTASPRFPLSPSVTDRAAALDNFADQWFRTVTEIMWPSGMFTPDFYANTADVAEQAWWDALEPSLPTAIRYLVEGWADDLVPVAAELTVPTVVLSPGFDEAFMAGSGGSTVRSRFHDGWAAALDAGAALDHRIVDGARFLIWEDRPEVVVGALEELAAGR